MEDIFQEPSPSFTTILSQWKQQDAIAVTQTPSRDHISSLGNSSHHKQQPDTKVRKKSREDVKKEIADLRRSQKLSKAMSKRLFRMPKNVYQQPLQHQSDYVPPQFPHTFVEQDLIRRALGQNFVFSDLTHKDLVPLVAAFETCTFAQGEVIIRQGDPGDYFYILQSGTVSFHVNFRKVGQAGKGASFGELALLYTCPRAATVEAMEPVTLFRVDQMTFRHILQTQTKASEDEKMKLLEGVNFLRDLTPSDLKKLAHVMTPRVFQKEEVLVKKGDPGDAFYIIQEGEVLVKDISVGTTVYEDQTLGAGEYFGERSLATSEPRAANVVGLKKGIAFSIDRSTFEKILGGMSQLILKAQDVRKLSGVSVLQKANLDARQLSSVAALITDRTYSEGASLVKLGKCYEASLYFVREGEVRVDYGDMRSEVVGTGGYFGQEMIESLDGNSTEVVSTFDAVCTSRCHVGVLMLSTCRTVFDVSALVGSGGSSPPTPTVPSITMDDLEKHRILGEGTFGQVWLVTMKDERDKVPYALKVQVKNDLEREGQLRAVVDEKRVLEKLNHPFIVRLVKAFHNPSYVYMMLEMVQGGELFSVLHEDLENPGLPESQCRFYALAIGDALAHMVRSGIDGAPPRVLLPYHSHLHSLTNHPTHSTAPRLCFATSSPKTS